MHIHSYGGCDSDSPGSDQLPSPDSEASSPQFHRSLIILLDDDDDDGEFEQPAHPLPSHRPKRPLPRRFSRKYHSPIKEATVQGNQMSHSGVNHTISYTQGLHDEGLEEHRVERYVTMGEPPKPISSGMGGNPPSFLPWCEPEGNAASQAGQVESPIPDVQMDD